MENKIVTAIFKDSTHTKVSDVWQYDYGQILRIQGLDLPTAVEVDFAVAGASESIARIGTTKDGVTDVVIPDSLIETGKNLVAYIYLRDSASGNTEYQIDMLVTKRAKPEAYDRPEDKELFGQAIEAVNAAADRAEKAGKTAQEAATKTGQDAEQTAQDRVEVAKMVETVTDISEQVKKVEELSNKAQESATQAGASAVAAEKAKAQVETAVGKTAEDRIAVNQAKIAVDEVQKTVRADRAAVEEVKQSVEQLSNAIPESTQVGVQAVNQAKQSAVQEVTQTGTAQKTAVEGAGTQAVENVENVKASATTAVETVKTEAVQSVQTEGSTQTGNVTTEGTKQVKAVQDKGNEVLQSIPEDFQMQMESKLDKQQGVENKGKALVIGEDGNVAPGEVQSGGDGIAIVNTASGESPLVIPDSAERVNKGFGLTGKTEQVQTSGKNLLDVDAIIDRKGINGSGEVISRTGSCVTDFIFLKPETYTFSLNNKSKDTQIAIYLYNDDKTFNKYLLSNLNETSKIIVDKNMYMIVMFNKEKSIVLNKHVMLEIGSNKTDYEPYTGGKPSPSPEYPQEIKNSGKWNEETQKYEVDVKVTNAEQNWSKEQTITITSDRPITKWDKLVEQGGEIGWLYKSYVGKMPKTGYSISYKNDGKNYYFRQVLTTPICDFAKQHFNCFENGDASSENGIDVANIKVDRNRLQIALADTSVDSIQEFESYLQNLGELEFLYRTSETEFVPLPQSEQNAIRALKTYYPTTVITVDGGGLDPDIKVTYTADTKNYIDNKVSAKVASIIRQYRLNTANLLSLMPMETQAAMIENDTNNILENAEEMKHE